MKKKEVSITVYNKHIFFLSFFFSSLRILLIESLFRGLET